MGILDEPSQTQVLVPFFLSCFLFLFILYPLIFFYLSFLSSPPFTASKLFFSRVQTVQSTTTTTGASAAMHRIGMVPKQAQYTSHQVCYRSGQKKEGVEEKEEINFMCRMIYSNLTTTVASTAVRMVGMEVNASGMLQKWIEGWKKRRKLILCVQDDIL